MADLVQSIKKAALEAVDASKPAGVLFGTVINTEPLEIDVEQRLTLTDDQLIISQHLTDYEVQVNVNWNTSNALGGEAYSLKITGNTGSASGHTHSKGSLAVDPAELGHSHTLNGQKTMMIMNKLQPGDQVILFRMQGGQKFIVLDRMV